MFRKKFNFLSVAGIQIGLDVSWLIIALLLSWTLAAGYFPFNYPGLTAGVYWSMGIMGMLGLFVCIVLHELGHAFVAKYYQLPISQITLFIFGGIAEIKKEPQSPKVEFLMAIAGPIVSVVLAILLFLITQVGEQHGWSVWVTGVTGYLAYVNIALAIFNMIPAFPLDGGRVFRSILWAISKNLGWATKVATIIGSAFGFFLIFFGIFLFISGNIFGGMWMAIIGLFLRRAATSTQTQFYISKELKGEKVTKFMSSPITVPSDISLQTFVDQYVYQSRHHLYPVVDDGVLKGYISLEEVKPILQSERGSTKVSQQMIPLAQIKTLSSDTNAMDALNMMQSEDVSTALIADGSKLVGILTSQDLLKAISLKLELEQGTQL